MKRKKSYHNSAFEPCSQAICSRSREKNKQNIERKINTMGTLNNRNKMKTKKETNRSFHAENIGSTKFSGRQVEKQERGACVCICVYVFVCVCCRHWLTGGGQGESQWRAVCGGGQRGRWGLFISSCGRFVCGRRASAPADTWWSSTRCSSSSGTSPPPHSYNTENDNKSGSELQLRETLQTHRD